MPHKAQAEAVTGGTNPSTAFAALPPCRAVSEQVWVENSLSFDPVLSCSALPGSLMHTSTNTNTSCAVFTGVPSCPQDQPLTALFSPRADRAASCLIYTVLLTCCSRHRIICALRSFSGLLGAVASTHFANSCLPFVHNSELRGDPRAHFTGMEWRSSECFPRLLVACLEVAKPRFSKARCVYSEVSTFKAQPCFAPESTHLYKPHPLFCCAWAP